MATSIRVLGTKLDFVLRTAVHLGVTTLPAKASYFGDGEAWDADVAQSFSDVVEFVGLNDGGY